jgi:hypothetical protein
MSLILVGFGQRRSTVGHLRWRHERHGIRPRTPGPPGRRAGGTLRPRLDAVRPGRRERRCGGARAATWSLLGLGRADRGVRLGAHRGRRVGLQGRARPGARRHADPLPDLGAGRCRRGPRPADRRAAGTRPAGRTAGCARRPLRPRPAGRVLPDRTRADARGTSVRDRRPTAGGRRARVGAGPYPSAPGRPDQPARGARCRRPAVRSLAAANRDRPGHTRTGIITPCLRPTPSST